MVSIYGLNKRVGNISYYDSQGREMFTKPYSEDTAKIIDEEVSKLIEAQYNRAIDLLTENQEKLKELANKLLTSEVIFKEDLKNIFGKRPWDKEENEAENVDVKSSEQETEVANNTTEENENAEEMDSKDKVESDETDPAT